MTPTYKNSTKTSIFLKKKDTTSNTPSTFKSSYRVPLHLYQKSKQESSTKIQINQKSNEQRAGAPLNLLQEKLNKTKSKEYKNRLILSKTPIFKKELEYSQIDANKNKKITKNTQLKEEMSSIFSGFAGTFKERKKFQTFINEKVATFIKNRKSKIININEKKNRIFSLIDGLLMRILLQKKNKEDILFELHGKVKIKKNINYCIINLSTY